MTRPLRFAFVTTFYPPYHFGGDAIGVERLAHALVRRGHHVTVIHDIDAYQALHRGPLPQEPPAIPGLDVVRLRSGWGMLSPLLTQQLGRPVLTGGRLKRLMAEGRFDVINYHNVSLVGGPGLFRYGNAAKIYMAHEHWLVCPTHVLWRFGREQCPARACIRCQLSYRRPPQWWRQMGTLERSFEYVDTFIAMSEFSRQKHLEFGFSRPMKVLPYFLPDIDLNSSGEEAKTHSRPYFLFVGRLEEIKGLQDVIPLFRNDLGADLLVAGEGTYGEPLRRMAGEMPSVRFLGRVNPEELSRYYRGALALIVPSVCFETFGIILIEAFRQGVPVIARRVGPFPEIVERAGGAELFETPAELQAALLRLKDDPVHRARLASLARSAFLEHWSEEAVIPKYLEIVAQALSRSKRRMEDA